MFDITLEPFLNKFSIQFIQTGNTTKQEICDFFQGVNIVNGENGIHLVTLATNNSKPLGEAYIELASNDDLQLAHEFHKKNLGTRYIEGNLYDSFGVGSLKAHFELLNNICYMINCSV